MNWVKLGRIPPTDLVEARQQLHWAVQAVAAVGNKLVAPAPDDSHTSMRWRPEQGLFAGAMTPQRFYAALDPASLTLKLLSPGGTTLRELELASGTLNNAFDWLNTAIVEITDTARLPRLERPTYYMDPHSIATGARFSLNPVVQLGELVQWFSNAASVLESVQLENQSASPVRCWPHHLDIATLILLDPEKGDAEDARSIGVGMSPGDSCFEEPYFYVRPWPTPQNAELPAFEGPGEWNTMGWLGAVLKASDIVRIREAPLQWQAVVTHLRASINACRKLLPA